MMHPHMLNKQAINKEQIVSPRDPRFSVIDYLPKTVRETDHTIPEKPIAIEVPLSNKRIISQQGCFTLHGSEKHTIDHYFKGDSAPKIIKFLIEEKNGNDLQASLFMCGYKEDNVYQDLNSLSKRIVREWSG